MYKNMSDTIRIDHGTTRMIAHRGICELECQNTASAFVAAGNHTYFGIESDVRISKDGVYYMFHDGGIEPRVLGKEEWTDVVSMTWDELSEVCLFDWDGNKRTDLRIPLLTEYLRICDHYKKVPILEIKEPMTPEEVLGVCRVVKENFRIEDIVFISFNRDYLRIVRKELPDSTIQVLTNSEINDEMIEMLLRERWDIDSNHSFVTKEAVEKLHANGIKCNCWTVDDPERGQQLCDWGVDFITTDYLE